MTPTEHGCLDQQCRMLLQLLTDTVYQHCKFARPCGKFWVGFLSFFVSHDLSHVRCS